MAFPGSQAVTVTGFPSPGVRVMDIADPQSPVECAASVSSAGGTWSVTATAPTAQGQVFAFDSSDALAPAFVTANTPFSPDDAGADVLILTHSDFLTAASELKKGHEAAGLRSLIATTDQVYGSYSYGSKSPKAIRDFLSGARTSWQRKPQYLLLLGDASFDPRNYLGIGEFDYVPTKMLDTKHLETASDDWFAGAAELAVGRLPARTAAEAARMAAKAAAYRSQPRDVSWRGKALLVADQNDGGGSAIT